MYNKYDGTKIKLWRLVIRTRKTAGAIIVFVSIFLFVLATVGGEAVAQPAMNRPVTGHGPTFIDEDGDGFNDNAPDHDGDGIPNGRDADYTRPKDGSGRLQGQGNAQASLQGQGNSRVSGQGNARGNGRGAGRGAGNGKGRNQTAVTGVQKAAPVGAGGGQRLRDGSGAGGQFGPGTCPGTGSRGRTVPLNQGQTGTTNSTKKP